MAFTIKEFVGFEVDKTKKSSKKDTTKTPKKSSKKDTNNKQGE